MYKLFILAALVAVASAGGLVAGPVVSTYNAPVVSAYSAYGSGAYLGAPVVSAYGASPYAYSNGYVRSAGYVAPAVATLAYTRGIVGSPYAYSGYPTTYVR